MQVLIALKIDRDAGGAEVTKVSLVAPKIDVPQPELVVDQGPLGRLTPMETEVLRLAASGLCYSDIAEILVVTEGTIRTHMNHVTSKLDVKSGRMAAMWALIAGIIPVEDLLRIWEETHPHLVARQ